MEWENFTIEERAAVVRVAIYAIASALLVRAVLRIASSFEQDETYRNGFLAADEIRNQVQRENDRLEMENAKLRAALDDFEPASEKPAPVPTRDEHLYPG